MSSDDYINGWELGGICSTHIANESQVYLQSFLFVEKPEGKKPRGRLMCRREDNIKMHIEEMVGGGVTCIHLPLDGVSWRAC